MAKIFRVSGYLITNGYGLSSDTITERMKDMNGVWQQLHVEESEEFEPDEEVEDNCNLELLERHFKSVHSNVDFDRILPKKGELYRHFKTGKIVEIVGISRHTETEEVDVVYEHDGKMWSRPLEMFMSEVDKDKYPGAVQRYRFEMMEKQPLAYGDIPVNSYLMYQENGKFKGVKIEELDLSNNTKITARMMEFAALLAKENGTELIVEDEEIEVRMKIEAYRVEERSVADEIIGKCL